MKSAFVCALLAFGSSISFGETVFELDFPAKEFKPVSKQMGLADKIDVSAENFIAGPDDKFAFQLSDDNARKKQTPNFSAGTGFPYLNGSVELTFKVTKQEPDSKVRLLHVFSPSKDGKSLLIYYFFVNEKGGFTTIVQCRNKHYKLNLPARLLSKTAFNTVKVAWDGKTMTVYHNGEKYEDAPLPAEYAEDAAKPRDWSTYGLLQMVIPDGDNWGNRVAIAGIKVENETK